MDIYVWILVWLHTCAGHTYKQYAMDLICGDEIEIYGADITMNVTSQIEAHTECNILLKGRDNMPYLNFEFLELSLPSCNVSELSISTGNFTGIRCATFTPHPELSSLCGDNNATTITGKSFTSTDKYMRVQFKWNNGVGSRGATFRLIVNSYKQGGSCKKKKEYRCRNQRCIHEHLTCNGHNPCGDHSDCSKSEEDQPAFYALLVIPCTFVLWIHCGRCPSVACGRCHRMSTCTCGIWKRFFRKPIVCARGRPRVCKCPCNAASTNEATTTVPETITTTATFQGTSTNETTTTVPEITTTTATQKNILHDTSCSNPDYPPRHSSLIDPPAYSEFAVDTPPIYIIHVNAAGAQDISEPPPSYSTVMANTNVYKAECDA